MDLDIIFHKHPSNTNSSTAKTMELIYNRLVESYQHSFNYRLPEEFYDIDQTGNPNSLTGALNLTIINKSNNKAIILNLGDRLEPSLCENHGFDHLNIVQIIGGQACDSYFYNLKKDKIDSIRFPLNYPLDKISEDYYLSNYNPVPSKTIKKAIFIGNIYPGRLEFVEYLKKHPLFEFKHSIREIGYKFSDYLDEMSKYAIILSLNGNGEICYRDFEGMGIQKPVLRSELFMPHYSPLIPDVHYIRASEPSANGFMAYNKPYKDITDQFIDKIEKVIDDEEFLNQIAINGRKYYIENGTISAIANNFFKIVNLDLLK